MDHELQQDCKNRVEVEDVREWALPGEGLERLGGRRKSQDQDFTEPEN